MAKVSRLSDDVLMMIFKECFNDLTEDEPCVLHDALACLQDHSRPYRWIRLAHVCHHWRVIILQMAVLWSKFVVGDLEFTRLFLTRSKTAPLSIKVPMRAQRFPTHEVFDTFTRIRSIELDVKSIIDLDLEPLFPLQAPILQRIVLRNHKALQQKLEIIQLGKENLGDRPIPEVFDHCPLPSLTNLVIEGFTPDWQNHLFAPALTSLTVRFTSTNNYGYGSMFDALDQMQNLRLLDLTFKCASLGWLTRQTRRVSLPKLEDFALHDATESCAYLLERLEFPLTTTVYIYIPEGGRASPSLPSLLAIACSRLSAAGAPRILTVGLWDSLHFLGPRNHFAFWDQVVDTRVISSVQLVTKPLLHIEIRRSWDWVALFTMGVSLGPVSDTHVLFIGSYIGYDDDPWELVKERMPKVHTLHFRPPDMGVLERLLVRDILHKSKRTNETQQFFSGLHTLVIQEAKFRALQSVPGLERGLSERKQSGRSIHTLELLDCEYISSYDVNSFRRHVDQVIWEKEEEPSDDEDGDNYDYAEEEYGTESSYQSSEQEI
ncbi:hypothetical protein NLI96_g2448 [Meripilus lineatus]|uniref:F-box domain-containing protein n=1 Tax=Meripilus lineatus TaxID=2056292 RepID=A0AAD5YGK3_9APHY|nr:hypothetical protein NLI96_g2448 [Physisporinus lineatus]